MANIDIDSGVGLFDYIHGLYYQDYVRIRRCFFFSFFLFFSLFHAICFFDLNL